MAGRQRTLPYSIFLVLVGSCRKTSNCPGGSGPYQILIFCSGGGLPEASKMTGRQRTPPLSNFLVLAGSSILQPDKLEGRDPHHFLISRFWMGPPGKSLTVPPDFPFKPAVSCLELDPKPRAQASCPQPCRNPLFPIPTLFIIKVLRHSTEQGR